MLAAVNSDLADLRRSYAQAALDVGDLAPSWHEQFARWFEDASAGGVLEPNAMVLGTVTDGVPTARTVLLKGFSADGFVFYTNRESLKGRSLAAVPAASLVFPWYELERQVVVAGSVSYAADEVSDAYFASRPRGSQLGAWASLQSSVVPSQASLGEALAEVEARYAGGSVPRPPHWGGYVVEPVSVEFWQGRPNRLHDRLRFVRSGESGDAGAWRVERLAP